MEKPAVGFLHIPRDLGPIDPVHAEWGGDERSHRMSDDPFQWHPDHVLKTAITVEDAAVWREHDRALLHLLNDRPIRLVGISDGINLWADGSLDDNRVHVTANIVQCLLSGAQAGA